MQRGLLPLFVRFGVSEDVEPELGGCLATVPSEEPLRFGGRQRVPFRDGLSSTFYLLTLRQKSKISTMTAQTPMITEAGEPMLARHRSHN